MFRSNWGDNERLSFFINDLWLSFRYFFFWPLGLIFLIYFLVINHFTLDYVPSCTEFPTMKYSFHVLYAQKKKKKPSQLELCGIYLYCKIELSMHIFNSLWSVNFLTKILVICHFITLFGQLIHLKNRFPFLFPFLLQVEKIDKRR